MGAFAPKHVDHPYQNRFALVAGNAAKRSVLWRMLRSIRQSAWLRGTGILRPL
jgi:hypothetical protein